jgi:hypothetical protein
VEAEKLTKVVMSESTWYYTKNKQKVGPVPLDSLKEKRRQGELGDDALVWTEGWESWKKVGEVPELAVLEPPPLPPEEPPPLSTEVETPAAKSNASPPEITKPHLPFAVSIHGKHPENPLLLKNDEEWAELLRRCHSSVNPAIQVDRGTRIRNIRNHCLLHGRYGLIVEPAEKGADHLNSFFGGRRMLDFRSTEGEVEPAENDRLVAGPPMTAEEPLTAAEGEPTEPPKCPNCGYESPSRANHCGYCGESLRDNDGDNIPDWNPLKTENPDSPAIAPEPFHLAIGFVISFILSLFVFFLVYSVFAGVVSVLGILLPTVHFTIPGWLRNWTVELIAFSFIGLTLFFTPYIADFIVSRKYR